MWSPALLSLVLATCIFGITTQAKEERNNHAGGAKNKKKKPPHIVFMLVDDLGWNDMGFHDQFGQIRSPKIDALRNQSIKLDQYYVYRFCSPTRSTIMTGRYPWHLGQHTTQNLNPMPGIACGINLKYKFIAELLKEKANYTTWALGKWHLGFLTNEYTPTHRGFERYLGYYSGAEAHFTHEKKGTGDDVSKSLTAYDLANNTCENVAPCLGPVGNASSVYSSYLYGNETLRMLEQHDPNQPLYIYLAWNNVHSPNQAPQNYLDVHKDISNKGRQGLAAMVSALDDQLTAVVDKFKEKGMWDNTILVFSTDNGGNLGGSGINYPLRGGKYTFWQGGVRGLGFVAGGLVPQHLRGSTWEGSVHVADWYATFTALAGVDTSDSGLLPVDGIDVSKALLSGGPSPRQEVVIQIVSNSSRNDHALPPPHYCQELKGTNAHQHCRPPGSGKYGYSVADGGPSSDSSSVGLSCGVIIQGKWKFIWGYPGWRNDAWNGWIKPEELEKVSFAAVDDESDLTSNNMNLCNITSPCLFDIFSDPTEHHDVAAENHHVVSKMKDRVLELLKGEVTLADSGLCPTDTGTNPDPKMTQLARQTGFWEPWLT